MNNLVDYLLNRSYASEEEKEETLKIYATDMRAQPIHLTNEQIRSTQTMLDNLSRANPNAPKYYNLQEAKEFIHGLLVSLREAHIASIEFRERSKLIIGIEHEPTTI